MARPKSIDDEQILEAAREVFLKEGISATTAEIAECAGISEGTIYRRWSTKNDLFADAMDVPFPPAWFEMLDEVDDDDDLFETLTEIGIEMIEFFKEIIPKMNMVMCNLDETQMFHSEADSPPVRGTKRVTQFFHRQRQLGRIKRRDPEIVARMFLGALHHFAFSEVSGLNDVLPMPEETYVRSVVKNLLEGIGESESPSD